MNIKVNGVTSLKQMQQLDGLNVDFAGLVFDRKDSRFVGDLIKKKEIANADLDIKTVGIFVNARYDEIMEAIDAYDLDVIQLHGDEPASLCEQLSAEIEVIKTFSIGKEGNGSIDDRLQEFDEACDYYLFTGGNGSGDEKFDWEKVSTGNIEKPFFLSGGILPPDGGLVKKFRHPDFYGVDLIRDFEKAPGAIDMAAVLQFTRGLK